jgi:Cu-processing system permease protein
VKTTLRVAVGVLREAASRRWFLALGVTLTVLLCGCALALQMDVVDGALAAARLFGRSIDSDIRPAGVALRFVFRASAYVSFYGGLLFGTIACSEFAPSLLAPGRVALLLSLPVRRSELIAGTVLGVSALAVLGATYGAGGLALLLGAKTGVWTLRPLAAALLASVAFIALYGPMMAVATYVRSASLSATMGGGVLVLGIAASRREQIAAVLGAGVGRDVFLGITQVVPRLGTLADMCADLAASLPVDGGALAGHLAGAVLFGLAGVTIAIQHVEQRDF